MLLPAAAGVKHEGLKSAEERWNPSPSQAIEERWEVKKPTEQKEQDARLDRSTLFRVG